MRRTLFTTAVLLPLAVVLAACGGTSSTAGSAADAIDGPGEVTLNVGDQKGGSQAILQAAGELKNLHYKIKWSTFTSGPPLLEAVGAKAVDIGSVGNTPPIFAAASRSQIKVVAAQHGSSEGDAIVVPKDSSLREPGQLRSKTVAVAQGSSAHYQLIASLRQAGLSIQDVKVTYLQPADALAAFTSGKVDAWAVWDPYTSQVVLKNGARILTNGQKVVNGLSFQVASASALADKRKAAAIGDYLERLTRAQNWVYQHPETWAKVWARDTGLPEDVALASVKRTNGTRVPVAVDNQAISSEQQIADTFERLKLIPRRVRFADFVDSRYNGDLPPSTTRVRSY